MTGVDAGAPVVPARVQELAVGGRPLALLRAGAGRPLLYLHGICDVHAVLSGDAPSPFLAGLAEQASAEVLAPPLPGYPGSPRLDEMHDVEDYVFHLADLLDVLGLDRVDVVGHSLGGWLAAELALRRPDRVGRLVLVAPLGLHVRGVEVPPVFGALAPRGTGEFAEARRMLFADPDGAAALATLPDGMADDVQLRWFGGLAGAARLGWKAPHFQSRRLAGRLGRIAVPALVLVAEQDLLVPEPVGRAWVDGLADAALVEVPDAGHAVVLEWPDVAAEAAAFVGR